MKGYFYNRIGSTNTMAKRMIKDGAGEDFFLLANTQTKGRGQFERSFFSPPDTGFYLSIARKINGSVNHSDITKAVAVAVCRAVGQVLGVTLRIKPVNDLFLDGKKVGGILVESFAGFEKESFFAVVGIGLNLLKPKDGFPKEIEKTAGWILETDVVDKKALAYSIIAEIENMGFSESEYKRMVADGYEC